MEAIDTQRIRTKQHIPKVPIKTYHWEDVRRSRLRGGYPWTHLTKPPFDELVDADEFSLEAFRRSRSTPILRKTSTLTLQFSETEELYMKMEESPHNGIPEEEKENFNPERKMDTSSSTLAAAQTSRSKSEEPKKKRKLSIESRVSKISLTKIKFNLKETKAKLKGKLPKRSKSDAADIKPKKPKLIDADSEQYWKPPPENYKPVYIHIPLKPPPGVADEFSKYEFETPGPSSHSGSLTQLQRIGSGRKMSLLGLLTQLKHLQELKLVSESKPENQSKIQEEKTPQDESVLIESYDSAKQEAPESEQTEPLIESYDSAKEVKKRGKGLHIEEVEEDYKKSPKSGPTTPEPIVFEPEDSSNEDNISQYLDKDDRCEVPSQVSDSTSTAKDKSQKSKDVLGTDPEKIRKIEATLSAWKKPLGTSSFRFSVHQTQLHQQDKTQVRAKSEEPKRKRRSSIDSSHSRKSLSKDAFLKRLKETKDKIKFPKFPSFGKSDKKEAKKPKKEVELKKTTETLKSAVEQPDKPVYIHIPLKLPPGETDEFSYLAEEEPEPIKEEKKEEKEEEQDDSAPTSPEEPPPKGVQMIILSPPSDDEILDPKNPETPSESGKVFFETLKIDELRTLAKRAVDEICPDHTVLETVVEDEGSDEQSAPESSQEVLPGRSEGPANEAPSIEGEEIKKQILYDEEDGLKLSDAAIAMINEELAKEEKALREAKVQEQNEKVTQDVEEKETVTEVGHAQNVPEEKTVRMQKKGKKGKKAKTPKEVIDASNKLSVAENEEPADIQEISSKHEQEQQIKGPEQNEGQLQQQNATSEKVTEAEEEGSLKRKSRAEDGERIYEDVALSTDASQNKTPEKSTSIDTAQSMSVDEEKSYLDKKVLKETSLEDDYNKWSKSNDHEYEPINPPSEEIKGPVQTSERKTVRLPPEDELIHQVGHEDDNLSMEEVQQRIEERFFSSTPETRTSSRTEGEINTSQVDTSQLETLPLKKESRKKPIKRGSFNETIRNQAGKLKTKLQGIKKPNIKLPQRPKKPEIRKPSLKMPKLPKMPARPSLPNIHLPSFKKKESSKESWRERQFSTESNAGDSKKKIFDFRTYPRIFDRHKKKEPSSSEDHEASPPEFATVPRRKKGPVGSRWADKFNIDYADEDVKRSKEFDAPDIIRIPLHPDDDPMDVPSHTRYNEDIDNEDDYNGENREIHSASPFSRDYLKRWDQGEFHQEPAAHQYEPETDRDRFRVTDLDNEEQLPLDDSFDIPHKQEHSSGSLSEHRRGVLEEIDSDEFFLRQKGISEENIEVGKYLSSEIREAFRNPVNALSQLQSEDREYDLDISDQSEPIPEVPRRKPLRKPKRKKTPHVSNEQISFEQESEEEHFDEFTLPPSRPKRKSKKRKDKDVIPFQETIPIEEQFRPSTPTNIVRLVEEKYILSDNILADEMYDINIPQMYENDIMQGIEQPDIKISDPYYRLENFQERREPPVAPTRRHRSMKSLSPSEPESFPEEIIEPQPIEASVEEHEYLIPTPEPPKRPSRGRSRTRSQSESIQEDDRTSREAESLTLDTQPECVEVPCVQDIRDCMGYAVIDKSKVKREPPLPPSRFPPTPPPPIKKRAKKNKIAPGKFSTVPRSSSEDTPIRPLRNYSTLGGSGRASRSKSPIDDKENIDIGQYLEIDDEDATRRLQSGDVIQKMRDRPLPAPPRPPRRTKASTREAFRDISHERNLPIQDWEKPHEEEMLTQSEPTQSYFDGHITNKILTDIEQILEFDHEETVTHGALVIQPIDNAEILPRSQLNVSEQPVERNIHITKEYDIPATPPTAVQEEDYDETSEIPDDFQNLKDPTPCDNQLQNAQPIIEYEETSDIPEEFAKLKNPPAYPAQSSVPIVTQVPSQIQQTIPSMQEISILKAHKMQVSDLDVDTLRVNELQANKIIVSELDGISLQVSEINSKSGNLVLSGIELPPQLFQEMLRLSPTLQKSTDVQPAESTKSDEQPKENAKVGKKKTPIEYVDEQAPPVPPRCDSRTNLLDNLDEPRLELESDEPPIRPPRKSSHPENINPQEISEINSEEPTTLQDGTQPTKEIYQHKNIEESSRVSIESQTRNVEKQSEEVSQQLQEVEEQIEVVQQEINKESEDRSELPVLPVYPPESSESLVMDGSKSEEDLPPRPPQPFIRPDSDYMPSQPPSNFYALRLPPVGDFVEEDIPLPPHRRKRHHKAPPISRSSSDDIPPAPRRHHRSPEPTIPQLTGQLVRACTNETDRTIQRLISHVTQNVLRNADGKQDLHVMILIMLVLIAGLLLLSGDETKIVHLHHWEFFNPPKNL